jgi:hypothetical protein
MYCAVLCHAGCLVAEEEINILLNLLAVYNNITPDKLTSQSSTQQGREGQDRRGPESAVSVSGSPVPRCDAPIPNR